MVELSADIHMVRVSFCQIKEIKQSVFQMSISVVKKPSIRLFVKGDQLFKSREGTLDLVIRDTVGDTEMSGTSKGRTRNEEQVELFGIFAEFSVVSDWCAREEVESSLGLYTEKSDGGQMVIEQISIAFIDFDIDFTAQRFGDDSLEKRRCIDKTRDPVGNIDRLKSLFKVIQLRMQSQVTDALTGQRKRFAVRITDDGVFVVV